MFNNINTVFEFIYTSNKWQGFRCITLDILNTFYILQSNISPWTSENINKPPCVVTICLPHFTHKEMPRQYSENHIFDSHSNFITSVLWNPCRCWPDHQMSKNNCSSLFWLNSPKRATLINILMNILEISLDTRGHCQSLGDSDRRDYWLIQSREEQEGCIDDGTAELYEYTLMSLTLTWLL